MKVSGTLPAIGQAFLQDKRINKKPGAEAINLYHLNLFHSSLMATTLERGVQKYMHH